MTTKKTIKIEGMHCGSCAQIIEEELSDKVKSVIVSVMDKKATIDFDENKISLNQIKETIGKLGYKAN